MTGTGSVSRRSRPTCPCSARSFRESEQKGTVVKAVSLSKYTKAVVGVIGAVIAGLQESFPGAHWTSLVSLAVTPLLVYLVPNTVPAAAAVPAPVPPAA